MVYKSTLFPQGYKKVEQDNFIPVPLAIYSDFLEFINVAKSRTASVIPSFILFFNIISRSNDSTKYISEPVIHTLFI